MSKIGLKMLSSDINTYYESIKELYHQGIFDYIELYIVPQTSDTITKWKEIQYSDKNGKTLRLPFILHAPDQKNNINLADASKLDENIQAFKEVEIFRQELNAMCTVVSCGTKGFISETIRQLKIIKPLRIAIKNNLYRTDTTSAVGGTVEEVAKVRQELNCGFCLDISNAIASANSQSYDPYDYLRQFNTMNPLIYRISGNNVSDTSNKHENLESATYNYSIISLIIRNNALITINSDRKSTTDLNDFKNDVQFLRKYCK